MNLLCISTRKFKLLSVFSKFSAYLLHIEMYLYPDLSLYYFFSDSKKCPMYNLRTGLTTLPVALVLFLLLLRTYSFIPSLSPLSLAFVFLDSFSWSSKHDDLKKKISSSLILYPLQDTVQFSSSFYLKIIDSKSLFPHLPITVTHYKLPSISTIF